MPGRIPDCSEGRTALAPRHQGQAHAEGRWSHQHVRVDGRVQPHPAGADQATFQLGRVWAMAQQAGFRESVWKSLPSSATSE